MVFAKGRDEARPDHRRRFIEEGVAEPVHEAGEQIRKQIPGGENREDQHGVGGRSARRCQMPQRPESPARP